MVKNIIFIENSNVSVIRLKKDRLEFLRKDGEVEFPLTVDFWDWWKKSLSYIDRDEVDICYIYDKDYDILHEKFVQEMNILNSEESSWNLHWIKEYFWKLKPTYFSITIVGLSEQEYSLGGDDSTAKFRKKFYTNLDFNRGAQAELKNKKTTRDIESSSEQITDEDFSPVAKYFIDMIRRERG